MGDTENLSIALSHTWLILVESVFSLRFRCHSPIPASNFKINSPGQKFTRSDFPLQKIN